ncbi:MAG: VWA domain-containing protein [Acidobacteriota bacterium]
MRFSRAITVVLLLVASALAQQQTPAASQQTKDNQNAPAKEKQSAKDKKESSARDKEDVVRISVTLVQIDAVVTDEKGRFVTDLERGDFEVFEDDRRQHLTNFSYISTEPTPREAPSTPSTRSGRNLPLVPPVRLRPDQVRRTIALVVDDLSMSFESVHFVRESLKKFVDEQMQPGDLVAIIRTGAGIGALQQFTTDKRLLYAAIERVRWNMMGRGHVGAFRRIGGGAPADGGLGAEEFQRFKDETERAREDAFSVGTLGALNFIVRGLKDLPGRKSVILLSDGFELFRAREQNYKVLDAVRRLVDLANRASVIVYTIDARGLQTLGLTAADSTASMSSQEVRRQVDNRSDHLFNSQGGLGYLAYQTGGFFVRNTNDIAGGINRVLDDQKGYYLLGYIPEQSTFKVVQGRRKFHKISVKVKRAGLRVRSRTGFYGVPDEETRPAETPAQQIVTALTSPFTSGDIHLKLTSLFGHDPKIGSFMRSIMHIDARDISFSEEQDGWRKGEVNIVAFTFGDNGQVVDSEGRTYNLSVRSDGLQKLMDQGFVYTLNVPIKKPGGYQLRVAVRDARTERVGSANQFIEVPDIGKNRLTLSGLVISGYDLSKARKTAATETADQAAQQAASVREGAGEDVEPMTSPAVRMLRRGIDVDYGFLIYNAQLDPKTKQPQLETQVLLLKDGKQVFAGKVNPFNAGEQPDLKHIPATGRLRLGSDLAPGEYVLQVVVIDKLAKEKYRLATQWMDFELVK